MVVRAETQVCGQCGLSLHEEPWSGGLCSQCLLELALEDSSLEAKLGFDPEDAPTLQFTQDGFAEGEVQALVLLRQEVPTW